MIRPDSKFAHRTNSSVEQSRVGGSDSKFLTGIGHSSDDNTFGKADNKYKTQPKSPSANIRTGRTDRGQPLYHGDIEPGDDGYDDPELDGDMNSLEIKDLPKIAKSHKS